MIVTGPSALVQRPLSVTVEVLSAPPGAGDDTVTTGPELLTVPASVRSKTARVSLRESWCTSAAIVLSPLTSTLVGIVYCFQVTPSAAVTFTVG